MFNLYERVGEVAVQFSELKTIPPKKVFKAGVPELSGVSDPSKSCPLSHTL
jgi:hypothetical protein